MMKITMNINKGFHEKLTLLKTYCECVLYLLDNFSQGYILCTDEETNAAYLTLVNKIESILREKRFSELAKDYRRPFKNLLGGEIRDADIYWREGFIGNQYRDFYSKIQEFFIKLNKEPLPLQSLPNYIEVEADIKLTNETIRRLESLSKQAEKKFGKTAKKLKRGFKKMTEGSLRPKIKLSSQKIKFNDDEAVIKIGKQKCPFPPHQNEHLLCRAMFEYPVSKWVSWDEIYEKVTGDEPLDKTRYRTIYDTVRSLNKRIREIINTEDNFFTWKERTVKRNY